VLATSTPPIGFGVGVAVGVGVRHGLGLGVLWHEPLPLHGGPPVVHAITAGAAKPTDPRPITTATLSTVVRRASRWPIRDQVPHRFISSVLHMQSCNGADESAQGLPGCPMAPGLAI
jgi:hypothetical protein